MRIFQIADAIMYGDAVSNDIFAIKKILDKNKIENGIYTLWCDERTKSKRKNFVDLPFLQNEDVVLFHYSGGSSLVDRVKNINCKKGLIYHNITPAHFYDGYNDDAYLHCQRGLEKLRHLSEFFNCGIGDSEFNTDDLKGFDFKNLFTLPIIFDVGDLRTRYKTDFDKDEDGETKILFTGRMAPNKRFEDLVKSFFIYNKYINQKSRLIFAGNDTQSPKYTAVIKRLVDDLGLGDNVDFEGFVPEKELYRNFLEADVFLCLSEHEGFCVPLLESMCLGLPVVALKRGAVSETLGDQHPALLNEVDYELIAESIDKVIKDKQFKKDILDYQYRQLDKYSEDRYDKAISNILEFFERQNSSQKINKPTFSVIINTYNRWSYLQELMRELEKQDYPFFEVIIVNGPSDDETYKVKELYPNIKYTEINQRNLSYSRNVGIKMAAGDYIVFIDDDALPGCFKWLGKFLKEFNSNQNISAIGGPVKHCFEESYEFYRVFSNHYGQHKYVFPCHGGLKEINEFNELFFEGIPGGNVAFKRKHLIKIGGFDEFFIYYLDETDVCSRFVKKNYIIKNDTSNFIRHFKGDSTVRGNGYNINWNLISRSIGYYGMKNGKDTFFRKLFATIRVLYKDKFLEIVSYWRTKKINFSSMCKYLLKYVWGGFFGIFFGVFKKRKLMPKDYVNDKHPYKNFLYINHENRVIK